MDTILVFMSFSTYFLVIFKWSVHLTSFPIYIHHTRSMVIEKKATHLRNELLDALSIINTHSFHVISFMIYLSYILLILPNYYTIKFATADFTNNKICSHITSSVFSMYSYAQRLNIDLL